MESFAIKRFLELMPKLLSLLNTRECLGNFSLSKVSYSKLAFLTRNSLFLLETHFSYSKLAFLTRNSLYLLETHFSYSAAKLAFPTRNSLFLLETRFSYSKLTFLTRISLFQGTLYLAAFFSRWESKTLLFFIYLYIVLRG